MKNKKLLSLLVLGLMVTGCDVVALPNDYEETYGAIKMEDVYDTVRNGQGEAALYNNLINLIAEKEITAVNIQIIAFIVRCIKDRNRARFRYQQ